VKKRKTNRAVIRATVAIRPPVNSGAYCGSQVPNAVRIQIRQRTDDNGSRTISPAVNHRRKADDAPEALAKFSIGRTTLMTA
jgi:hypothetical protein